MKKVLIIAGGLQIGGAERVARDIGWFADPTRFEIHYLVFGERTGEYEEELKEKGCKIVHMPAPGQGHLAFCRELDRLIKQERYDVVHSHTMFNSGLSLPVAKRNNVPVRIAHSHSIRGPGKRSVVKSCYESCMRRLILSCATEWVACGQEAGKWLYGKRSFETRGILIHNGINLEHFAFSPVLRQELREREGLTDRFVIGHMGHLAPVKNQAFLLECMPQILKRRPDAVLLLMGDGEDGPMLKGLIKKLGLESSVRLTGNVANVAPWLNAMDVFAFPSLYEGMPLALVEAQANGLPCVISDRIPRDVHLTDLVTALPLEEKETWIRRLISAQRRHSEAYGPVLKVKGLDTQGMLEKIYRLYEGA